MAIINVLYACDNNYAPYAGVSMFSLFENNRDAEEITVYLMADGVSAENQQKLQRTADSFHRNLVLIKDEKISKIIDYLNDHGFHLYRGSYTAYFRLFFDQVLEDLPEKLLYVDSDSIIAGSLAPIFEIEMQKNVLGMIQESLGCSTRLNFDGTCECCYYNSGVTLFNVSEWKKQDGAKMLLDHIQTVRACYPCPDQDLLNIVFAGQILTLGPQYNFQPIHRVYSDKIYFKIFPQDGYYSKLELENARQHPAILHTYRFLGDFPWHKNNYHPDTPVFDSYLRRSEWKDYVKVPANRGIAFKIEKLLFRILPKTCFLKLFSSFQKFSFRKLDGELLEEERKRRNSSK